MSRQKKNSSSVDSEINNQLFILQRQIDQYNQDRLKLIQSRNYAIIIATIAMIACLYLLLIKPFENDMTQQQALAAQQLAAHKQQLTDKYCMGRNIETTKNNSDHPTSKEKKSPDGNALSQAAPENCNNGISTVLNSTSIADLMPDKDSRREKQAIYRMINLWALAWELKDIPTYFSYYADSFDPQNKAKDFQEWKAKRSSLINKPGQIKITIKNLIVQHINNNRATVSFDQYYRTTNYADKSHKLMELVYVNNQWLIQNTSSVTTQVNFE